MTDENGKAGNNGEVMRSRIYLIENATTLHTDQLRELTAQVNGLEVTNARISTMQENASQEVAEIDRKHEAFIEAHRQQAEEFYRAIEEIKMKLAEGDGVHKERDRYTRVLFTILIALATIITNAITLYLK